MGPLGQRKLVEAERRMVATARKERRTTNSKVEAATVVELLVILVAKSNASIVGWSTTTLQNFARRKLPTGETIQPGA